MENPFSIHYSDHVDSELIQLAVGGDKNALNTLILRHQVFVYNVALKMTRSHDDANDLTQEVLIKVVTSLSRFEGKSQFRTWLYRIVVNHFLNMKPRHVEKSIDDFESFFASIEKMRDANLNEAEEVYLKDAVEDLRIKCTAGMLMCLDREQRMVFILGEMFRVDHNLGAAIMEITPGNFRVKLSRARGDIQRWMNQKCGLVNAANPCRCSRKTKAYIELGHVNPEKLEFNKDYTKRIFEISTSQALAMELSTEDISSTIFGEHPLQNPKENLIEALFNNEILNGIINM